MKYLLILLVPLLMILDYYLTILGGYFYKKFHRIKNARGYELNPHLKHSVEHLEFFDLNHFIATAVITCVLFLLSAKNLVSQTVLEFILGALIIPLAAANGRNLANILTLTYSKRRSRTFKDKSNIPAEFNIKISQYHLLFLLLPLIIIALVQPTPFIFGGIFAICALIMYHHKWSDNYSS